MVTTLIFPFILATALCPWVVTGQSQPFAPNLFFNWTTSVVDPVNNFFPAVPDRYGNRTSAYYQWNMTFDGSPWANYVPGMVGIGSASAIAGDAIFPAFNYTMTGDPGKTPGFNPWPWVPNASLSATVASTGWYVHGDWQANLEPIDNLSPNKMFIDGRSEGPRADRWTPVLSTTALVWRTHEYVFSAMFGNYTVQSITYALGMKTEAPSFEDVQTSVEYTILDDGSINPAITWKSYSALGSAGWNVSTTIGGVGGQDLISYPRIVATPAPMDFYSSVSRASVSVPFNTSFIVVNGTVGPDHRTCEFSTIPEFPEAPGVVETYNFWVSRAMLFFTALDPVQNYTLNLWCKGSAGIHSVTYYSSLFNTTTTPNSTTPGDADTSPSDVSPSASPESPPSKLGPILGGVIGGVGGAIVVGGLILLYLRASRNRSRVADRGTFEVDEDGAEKLSPYVITGGGSESTDGLGYHGGYTHGQMGFDHPLPSPKSSAVSPRTPRTPVTAISSSSTPLSPLDQIKSSILSNLPGGSRSQRGQDFMQHEDAGVVEIDQIPPSYNPQWLSPTTPQAGPSTGSSTGSSTGYSTPAAAGPSSGQ